MSTSSAASAVLRPVPQIAQVERLDMAKLVQPIPGPSPTGVSLRYDAEYDRIREARRDEDPNLPQGVWRRDVKRADWGLVVELCADALSERSKDLQIACWLAEALAYRDGLSGVSEGLVIIAALCDAFWPGLFPDIDDGDISARLVTIEWLDEKLAQAIYTLPLASAGATDAVSYSWTDYINAQRNDKSRSGDTSASETVLGSVDATPTAFYEDLREELSVALAAVATLKASLARCCGDDEPSLGPIRDALSNVAGVVDAALAQRKDTRKISAPPIVLPPPVDDEAVSSAVTAIVNSAVTELSSGARVQIRSRDEAYRMLMEIADYLFVVEPHSPTPYIVQRAASWGMMPLHKLLVELTRGSNDLAVLFELLGIGKEG
jgi:type VI secretion system ImpA family protein